MSLDVPGLARAAGPRALDRGSALPLWAQLLDDLRERLERGEFAGAFPGELALVAEYEVSRHTVREALRRLRAEGLVVAERGRPPRAAPAVIEAPLGALYSLFASVEAAGRVQRSVVRTLDVRADADAAARLDLDAATPLVHLERLRLADDEPLAVDRVWLPADAAGALLDADFTHTALYDELERRCGVRLDGGEEQIRAVLPTAAERRLLGVEAGVAAFAIERVGVAADRPVEWRVTVVRADRFAVRARFSAREGYHLDLTGAPAPPAAPRSRAPTHPARGAPSRRRLPSPQSPDRKDRPMSTPEVPSIDVAEAARLAADDAVLLLDVREPHEWLTGHAPGARHVPLGELHAGAVPTGRPVVAVCRSGNRSGGATAFLRQAGLDVRNLDGGMKAWAAAGHPVVTDDGRPGAVA